MSFALPGTDISAGEVTDITPVGFWLLANEREYFVPFDDYPEFRSATVGQIYAMVQIGPTQFHWPELDIDIELDALEQPAAFPLRFQR